MYLILTQCFPSRLGGIESLMSNLAINIGKKNKVLVFADQHHIKNDTKYDIQHQNLINIKRFSGIKFLRRRKKAKEVKKIIHSHFIECVIADTWKSLELCIDYILDKNIPIMCLAHGNELLYANKNKEKKVSIILKKTTAIVSNSDYTANLVKKIIGSSNKIKVVYPGANDLKTIKPDTSFKIEGYPILLTLSRLEKRKGHIDILKAVKKLKEKFPNIKYIIAGKGKEYSVLKNFVEDFKITSNVSFIGNVNEGQKKHLFQNVTLMVMPTIDERKNKSIEGFGISYMEAAFYGIPSIASKVGGTPEAVLHQKTGIIIENNELLFSTLNELLSDNKKIKELGKNAKQRAEKSFLWDKIVNNYLSTVQ